MDPNQNIIEGLHSEMNRVREIIKEYEDPALNGAGNLAAALMKFDIQSAEKAISSNDVVLMVRCYEKLKEYELN